jgi:hypothetical protein
MDPSYRGSIPFIPVVSSYPESLSQPTRAPGPGHDGFTILTEAAMKHLWRDIARQRATAWTFAGCWLALWVWTQATRNGPTGDISPVPSILLLFAVIVAGALVSWWRTREAAASASFWHPLLGGALAGMLLMSVNVVIVFAIEAVYSIGTPGFNLGALAEFAEWLISFGLFGLLLGFIGAIAGSSLARLRAAKRTAEEITARKTDLRG